MARMSIDDKFLRDPRVTQLALELRMSRWEAMGRLIAVFAVCYDLERDVISCNQVDLAAERPGFGDAMFAVDLAVNTRRGMRIRGAGKRIEYLAPKREAGRQGGIKSGESRRKTAKQKREIGEARLNPPDPVPDPAPDPVPEDQTPPPARAIAPAPEPAHVPPAPMPTAVPAPEMDKSVHSAIAADPRARGRLAELTYRRVSDARLAIAAELKLSAPLPFPAITPGSHTRGFAELGARIREEGAQAAMVCDRVVANLIAQAREERHVEWLAERVFGDKAWTRAKDWTPAKRQAPTTRRRKPTEQPLQMSTLTPEERIALAAEANAKLGFTADARAGPASARSTDENEQPQPARTPA